MNALPRGRFLVSAFLSLFVLASATISAQERDPLALKDWRVEFGSMNRAQAHVRSLQPNAVPSDASHFITMVPCRVFDTRDPVGPYGGPKFTENEIRSFDIPAGVCTGIPANASAFSVNLAVFQPEGPGWLTAWPTGETQPAASSLNYALDQTIANGIIVPAGTAGAIEIFSRRASHVILDINGYFVEGVVTNVDAGDGLSGGGTGDVTIDIEAEGVTPAMISPTGSSAGDVLTSDGSDVAWAAPTLTGDAGGDLDGTYPDPTIALTAGANIIAAINACVTTINRERLNGVVHLAPAAPQDSTSTDPLIALRLDQTGFALGTSGTSDLLKLSASGLYGGNPVDTERFRVDNSGSVLAVGGDAGTIPDSGSGVRMMWYASKAAFRAGEVTGPHWNDAKIGLRSFAAGRDTEASGNQSTAFGRDTIASAANSVAMGDTLIAAGAATVVLGAKAGTTFRGSLLFGDSSNTPLIGSAPDQFLVRAAGGTKIYSDSGMTTGVELAPGGGSWSAVSDRNRKENFIPVDAEDVLLRIRSIPISTWNYKSQNASIRHLGPMAQDFYAAFNVGEDQRLINNIDIDGVNLAAVQALESRTAAQQAEIEALKQRNSELEERLQRLESLLDRDHPRN